MPTLHELLINGRFLGRPITGVERFGREVLRVIDEAIGSGDPLVEGLSFRVVVPAGTDARIRLAHIPIDAAGSTSGHAWEQLELPRIAGGRPLINLCNTGPAFRKRQIVVIHDAATFAAPSGYSRAFRWAYRVLLKLIVRRADSICTVSRFSRSEILRWIGTPASPIVVLPEGIDHMDRLTLDESILDKFDLRRRPFLLAVGSSHPNKNFRLITDAIALMKSPPFDVAIVGGGNARVFHEAGAHPAVETPFVKRVGYVSDEQLACLYRHAFCLVFPSVYEGFGLPPLEAMSRGCPVIAVRTAAMPEVLGDDVRYVDAHQPASLLATLDELISDPTLRAELAARGISRARRYRWRNCAAALLTEARRSFGGSRVTELIESTR